MESLQKIACAIDTMPLSIASPAGKRILDFYSSRTSKAMPCYPSTADTSNPWCTEVMLMAAGFPLIRHGVLAVGECHLTQTTQDVTIARMASYYYAKTVSEVTSEILDWMNGVNKDYEPLFFAVILLAWYEHVCGDSTAVLFHLNAMRELGKSLGVYGNPREPNKKVTAMSIEFDVLTQYFSIFRLDNSEVELRTLALTIPQRLDALRNYTTFGSGLGAASDLLPLIPCIATLVIERRRHHAQHHQRIDLHTQYIVLQRKLSAWRYPADRTENIRDAVIKRGAAGVLLSALKIFLETAYWHQHITTHKLAAPLEPAVTFLWLNNIAHTPAVHNLAWPLAILGASITSATQREVVEEFLLGDGETALIVRVGEALRWVWNHPDEEVFGMHGLEMFEAQTGYPLPI